MALPKKGLRKITVDGVRYAWCATGNDDFISLAIVQADGHGQLLTAVFDYDSQVAAERPHSTRTKSGLARQQFIVTPYVVRQVILLGLARGWTPLVKAPQLNLRRIDDLIDEPVPTGPAAETLSASPKSPIPPTP